MSFISFPYLIAWNKNIITVLNRNGKNKNPCFISEPKGKDFTIEHIFAKVFHIWLLLCEANFPHS
jgi:hypothetical protein